MFLIMGFGLLLGVFTMHQKDFDACKKVNFQGEVCEWAKATCKLNKDNKCE